MMAMTSVTDVPPLAVVVRSMFSEMFPGVLPTLDESPRSPHPSSIRLANGDSITELSTGTEDSTEPTDASPPRLVGSDDGTNVRGHILEAQNLTLNEPDKPTPNLAQSIHDNISHRLTPPENREAAEAARSRPTEQIAERPDELGLSTALRQPTHTAPALPEGLFEKDPLAEATKLLVQLRLDADRPTQLERMSLPELVMEKADIKFILTEFERRCAGNGGVAAKTVMRSLYMRYREVKDRVQKSAQARVAISAVVPDSVREHAAEPKQNLGSGLSAFSLSQSHSHVSSAPSITLVGGSSIANVKSALVGAAVTPWADPDNALLHVEEVMRSMRDRNGRPHEIERMSQAEKMHEKRDLKRVLAEFEQGFEVARGRPPVDTDKEKLRPAYARYKKIRALVQQTGNSHTGNVILGASGVVAARGPSQAELLSEKRKLQRKLTDFEKQFRQTAGHSPQSARDREPMKAEWARYRQLKSILADSTGLRRQALTYDSGGED
eukprot:m.70579 g.70579  ORF g.70579 m.70579 type:complete len:496 (-) comp10022_c0_seq1:102-1589(-)